MKSYKAGKKNLVLLKNKYLYCVLKEICTMQYKSPSALQLMSPYYNIYLVEYCSQNYKFC